MNEKNEMAALYGHAYDDYMSLFEAYECLEKRVNLDQEGSSDISDVQLKGLGLSSDIQVLTREGNESEAPSV